MYKAVQKGYKSATPFLLCRDIFLSTVCRTFFYSSHYYVLKPVNAWYRINDSYPHIAPKANGKWQPSGDYPQLNFALVPVIRFPRSRILHRSGGGYDLFERQSVPLVPSGLFSAQPLPLLSVYGNSHGFHSAYAKRTKCFKIWRMVFCSQGRTASSPTSLCLQGTVYFITHALGRRHGHCFHHGQGGSCIHLWAGSSPCRCLSGLEDWCLRIGASLEQLVTRGWCPLASTSRTQIKLILTKQYKHMVINGFLHELLLTFEDGWLKYGYHASLAVTPGLPDFGRSSKLLVSANQSQSHWTV